MKKNFCTHNLIKNKYFFIGITIYISCGILMLFCNDAMIKSLKVSGWQSLYVYGIIFGNFFSKILMPVAAVISVYYVVAKISGNNNKKLFQIFIISSLSYIISQMFLIFICFIKAGGLSSLEHPEITLLGILSGVDRNFIIQICVYWIYSIIYISIYSILGYVIYLLTSNNFYYTFIPFILPQLSLYIPQLFFAYSNIAFQVLPVEYDIGVTDFSILDHIIGFVLLLLLIIILFFVVPIVKKRKVS